MRLLILYSNITGKAEENKQFHCDGLPSISMTILSLYCRDDRQIHTPDTKTRSLPIHAQLQYRTVYYTKD
jgi:hypothetical protein